MDKEMLNDEDLQQVAGGNYAVGAANDAAATLQFLGIEISARITATEEALNAKLEVHITLPESILRSTEVFISKDGKQIIVRFVTSSQESADFLYQHSGELRSELMSNLRSVDYVEILIEN